MTRKSAKYSCMARTTSWSSASASRSRDDFLMMLLKSGHSQLPHPTIASNKALHMLYSPYFGSRSSSIKFCIDSGDGRTKHRQRRCRIFSRFWLSNRLACISHMSQR
jgi:hypothetical protein